MVFRETGIGHLYSWGNWFAEKELNGSGATAPVAAAPGPDDGRGRPRHRQARLQVPLPDGTGVTLPANRVFHVPGFGFDGLVGYSRIGSCAARSSRRSRSRSTACGRSSTAPSRASSSATRSSSPRPPRRTSQRAGTRRTRASPTPSARRSSTRAWRSTRSASTPRGRAVPRVAPVLVEEIARGLRLSPHKLSDMSRATFSNIEESNIDHVVGRSGRRSCASSSRSTRTSSPTRLLRRAPHGRPDARQDARAGEDTYVIP
jgi:hypothetical protein